ncbi:MAG TPA: energy-coupling factor transporter ATPase [Bacilli bacterium]|jgi:energy-coupling factor transport system ATP-binding protein|nr:energy-coupling factor transporter ATPase [Bacilli bacterium]
MKNVAISLKNVSYSYDKKNDVIKNVSLDIEKGKFISVIGHNGSGKSTFAKLIMGLLEPKEGEIKIFDLPLDGEHISQIRPYLGIVFQNPDNQFIGATVRDDIAFGLENQCYPQNKMDPLIEEYASRVGMSELLDKEPGNLSGGQKQRVAIAGVLAMHPKIIVFDEATAMLDPQGKDDINKLIELMRKKNEELTLITITHNVEETQTSDEVIVFNEGEIYMRGKPEDVFLKADKLRSIRLDTPLLYRVKEAFLSVGIKLKSKSIDELKEEIWP